MFITERIATFYAPGSESFWASKVSSCSEKRVNKLESRSCFVTILNFKSLFNLLKLSTATLLCGELILTH